MLPKLFRARQSDAISQAIVWLTLLQLGVGVAVVKSISAQSPSQDVINAGLEYRQQSLDARMNSFEQLHVPERLAVLEQTAAELGQVKLLIYGVIVTLIGSLLAQIVQIRAQRHKRRQGDLEDDRD
jgi:hypothetical protein